MEGLSSSLFGQKTKTYEFKEIQILNEIHQNINVIHTEKEPPDLQTSGPGNCRENI